MNVIRFSWLARRDTSKRYTTVQLSHNKRIRTVLAHDPRDDDARLARYRDGDPRSTRHYISIRELDCRRRGGHDMSSPMVSGHVVLSSSFIRHDSDMLIARVYNNGSVLSVEHHGCFLSRTCA